MNLPVLSAEGITLLARRRRRGSVTILDGISLTAASGELVMVAGPSGSGKSTLLRVLAGITPLDAGKVCIGRPLRPLAAYAPRERARFMAFLPQENSAENPFSVRETVLFGRAPWQAFYGCACENDRNLTQHAMELLDVASLADCRVDELSGGEKQRVLLARVLCQTPQLMLLDEPTSAQDYGQQIRIMETLTALCTSRGLAVIMVTHDLNLAAMYAHRLLLFSHGQCAAQGLPFDVLTAARLEAIYHCPFIVDKHPCAPVPRITLSPLSPLHR